MRKYNLNFLLSFPPRSPPIKKNFQTVFFQINRCSFSVRHWEKKKTNFLPFFFSEKKRRWKKNLLQKFFLEVFRVFIFEFSVELSGFLQIFTAVLYFETFFKSNYNKMRETFFFFFFIIYIFKIKF